MHLVIESGRRITQRLSQVLLFEEGVRTKNLCALTAGRHDFQHPANSDPHSPNARFAAALPGLDGDAIKTWNLGHIFILMGFRRRHASNGPTTRNARYLALCACKRGEAFASLAGNQGFQPSANQFCNILNSGDFSCTLQQALVNFQSGSHMHYVSSPAKPPSDQSVTHASPANTPQLPQPPSALPSFRRTSPDPRR